MGKCEGKWKVSHQGLYFVMYLYVCVIELHSAILFRNCYNANLYSNTNKKSF